MFPQREKSTLYKLCVDETEPRVSKSAFSGRENANDHSGINAPKELFNTERSKVQCVQELGQVFPPTHLFSLSVRGGVVGDFEVGEVKDVFHLIVVSTSLANDDSHIK